MIHRRTLRVLFPIRQYQWVLVLALLFGTFMGNISAVLAEDPVPETGMNAPSDAGRGTVAEVSTTGSSRPGAGSRVADHRLTEPLPVVRLTPKDVLLPGEAWRGKLDLAGEWRFKFDVPATFDGTLDSIPNWDKARVPGHFSWQGFPEMHQAFNVPVAWGRTFMLPESWTGLRVRLRFESADGLTRVWVNGKKVGESETVNTPSEFDITHVLKNGENQIVVTIEKTEATYWSKRTMGGLARGVYLQAVPPVSLARLHVTSDIKSIGPVGNEPTTADVISHIRVANDTDQKIEGYSVKFSLTDSGSKQIPIRLRSEKILLPPVEAGTMLQVSLPLPGRWGLPVVGGVSESLLSDLPAHRPAGTTSNDRSSAFRIQRNRNSGRQALPQRNSDQVARSQLPYDIPGIWVFHSSGTDQARRAFVSFHESERSSQSAGSRFGLSGFLR
ncbi:MAG: hypothetical protein KatS3mg104_0123 [Phycisphaerae bacterium]|nr:MAG: hypothetical protein KatS3mg104_0123 [Phycisphaerae bacterium]